MKRLAPTGSGPQAYWTAMRALTAKAGSFAWSDVAARVPGVSRNTIGSYIAACLRAGHIEAVGTRPGPKTFGPPLSLYAVKTNRREAPLEKPGINTRGLGAAQRQLWTAMRAMPLFTTRDIALHASTDDVEISTGTARAYAAALKKAGYLQVMSTGGPSRFAVLRLRPAMNKGPAAPAVRGDGSVVERNVRARRERRAA